MHTAGFAVGLRITRVAPRFTGHAGLAVGVITPYEAVFAVRLAGFAHERGAYWARVTSVFPIAKDLPIFTS